MLFLAKKSRRYRYRSTSPSERTTKPFTIYQPLFAISCLAMLSSCANLAGPEYKRPEAPIKTAWSQPTGSTISASEAIRPDWWTGFDDPYLNKLVGQAIIDSIDIRILAARIEVARASLGQEKATLLPRASGATGAQFTEQPQGGSQQYSVQATLNWEIDIWGKLQKAVSAQEAALRATEADWRAGYLTLVSDVASTYFQIRQFDEQIDQQQKTLSTNQQILAVYKAQYKEGLVSNSKVLQQEAEVISLARQLLDLERQRKLAENRLATLLGIPAGELKVPAAHLRDTVQPVDVPLDLPSDLLSRRPDVIAAEYRVLQAHELVGQARLARLPSFSLTGSGGLASAVLSGLLKTWSLGLAPSITFPIFDPSLNIRVKVNEAQAKVVEEEYRNTVMRAFEEVENALVNLASRKAQQERLKQQLDNLRIVNDQIHAQLREGLISQLEVFESERSLLSAEQALLQNYQEILADTVTLYKALGGGWPKERVTLAGE